MSSSIRATSAWCSGRLISLPKILFWVIDTDWLTYVYGNYENERVNGTFDAEACNNVPHNVGTSLPSR